MAVGLREPGRCDVDVEIETVGWRHQVERRSERQKRVPAVHLLPESNLLNYLL